MMLAIQYIIGQMNAPLQQMIQFMRSGQDARISLERLGEIHNRKEEQNTGKTSSIAKGKAVSQYEIYTFDITNFPTTHLKTLTLRYRKPR